MSRFDDKNVLLCHMFDIDDQIVLPFVNVYDDQKALSYVNVYDVAF